MPNPKIIEFPLGTQYNLQYHYTGKISVSSAELLAINSVPKTLVAAPGAGFVLIPITAVGVYSFLTAAYAGNTSLKIIHTGLTDQLIGLGSLIDQIVNTTIQAFGQTGAPITNGTNKGLTLTELTGDPITGAGSLDIYLWYIKLEL